MDFYTIKARSAKNGVTEVYPDYKIGRSKDLMVRGKAFYAIWDEAKGLWSTDEYDVQRLVDEDLHRYAEDLRTRVEGRVDVKYLGDFSSSSWLQFRNYVSHISDSAVDLDAHLTFANSEVKKTDYTSKRLPYSLREGSIEAYDELMSVLYEPEERKKLEWAAGAVVAGDAWRIQKFLVLYGAAGAGKSTYLNILQDLFEGYYTTFEASSLTGNSNAFSTEVFKSNPLVAIQHDGDLSRIEDNTKLNSIVSHEDMTMNEKYKPSYTSKIKAFLFMGTNRPVKITDAKSGIIRRLIDVKPSGEKIPEARYFALMSQIKFELGSIAQHSLDVYRSMGKDYYASYRPIEMMLQTDVFYNFIEANFDLFKANNGATLNSAYDLYKLYCEESLIEYRLARHKFREEFKNYFHEFHERYILDGQRVRSYYHGFKTDKFEVYKEDDAPPPSLVMESTISLLDDVLSGMPAQYANEVKVPSKRWVDVDTTLSDLDTTNLHYVKVPTNHIVIDFDLKDANGNKDPVLNIEAASGWPATYSEYSQGGGGIHLHYIYDGDATELSRIHSEGIEVKVFVGDASLRRKLSRCNTTPIAHISEGLPVKEKRVIDFDTVKSERGLRALVERNLRKEIHAGTKPSVDFIHKILDDAYKSGLAYDLSDMRGRVLQFAMSSTNQGDYCVKLVSQMKFQSEEGTESTVPEDVPVVIYDIEVFPNLFVVCWMYDKEDASMVEWVNPSPQQIEQLLKYNLIGFNNRKYDNHILYARYMGYSIEKLYKLSQDIIANKPDVLFREGYSVSYTDIYDFSTKKQSLKKWQIELGIHHMELGLPWDQPVPPEMVPKVVEYCGNDVRSTWALKEHLKADFVARQILADLSGLTVNDTTNRHTGAIIFGKERHPQRQFVYTDLSEMFPGYEYKMGVSTYRGETVGEGGLVRSKPGMYSNVAVLDVASMHPTSIEQLNLFGPYTKTFSELKQARIAIKHKDYATARKLLDGKLSRFLVDESQAKALADALKLAINSVYGLTAASYENPFRDNRNKDNIVAKRGALFMIDLMKAVEERGFIVAHIKTDSIKIPNATPEIIAFVMGFGKKYGYDFEHEETYERMCLVNDAVYIARTNDGKWTATGAQFQHPYVFKFLFSKEKLNFDDLCETKSVSTALYLDFNENLPEGEHNYHFVGRVGRFTPVKEGIGGGILLREKDGEYHSASGAKGYRWLESEMVVDKHNDVDVSYFTRLVDDAVTTINQYGDFEWFVSDEPAPPWV